MDRSDHRRLIKGIISTRLIIQARVGLRASSGLVLIMTDTDTICKRCGGLLHDDKVAYTNMTLSTCFSCGESTDSLVELNRLYPDYTPPKRIEVPGTPSPTRLLINAIDILEDDIEHGHGYVGNVQDIADAIGIKSQMVYKARSKRKKARSQ